MFYLNKILSKNPIVIAPMAGISNGAFRELCFEFGAGLVFSEMVSDKAIYYKNSKTLDMLKIDDKFHPVALQIFGSDPKTMSYAAKVLDNDTNCDIIDVNMGCPVNKVVKTGAGCALMLDEDKAVNIVKNIISVVKKPVTVKMRLGYTNNDINFLSLSKKLENIGVCAITLHARTRTQMYDGKASWDNIKLLKENLNIPVIGNGDVKTLEDFILMKKHTNCDAIMIGRGVVGNPFLIKEISDYLNNNVQKHINDFEKIEMCLKHAQKLIILKGEKKGISEMRGLAPHYISGLYNATIYKVKLNTINSYNELESILNDYKKILLNK